jgi:hypothetical protein
MSDIYVLVDRDYDAHQFAMDYLNSTKFNQDQTDEEREADLREQAFYTTEHTGIDAFPYEATCHFNHNTIKVKGTYDPSTAYYPPGWQEAKVKSYEKKPTEKETMNKLILDHWAYIEGVLVKTGKPIENIQEIGYHYKTAFAHGWKHHQEYLDANHA